MKPAPLLGCIKYHRGLYYVFAYVVGVLGSPYVKLLSNKLCFASGISIYAPKDVRC
jgi:hypothetical protein